jgi:hypothetical protein
MWFVFALLITFILGGMFIDLTNKLKTGDKIGNKWVKVLHWSLVVIFYTTLIYWVSTVNVTIEKHRLLPKTETEK